jgi:hypothetical protein
VPGLNPWRLADRWYCGAFFQDGDALDAGYRYLEVLVI